MKKAADLLANLLVAFVPVLVLYLAVEFAAFKPFLPKLPIRYHQRLMEPYQMLAQRSKNGTLPRRYTLIVGDSYAAGWGDWLQSVDIGTNAAYGANDLLYDRTGVDTVQSAFAGGSVTETLVRKPVNRFRFLRKTWLYRVEDPERVLWFFYEGNDLVDDVHRLDVGWYKDHADRARFADPAYRREFLETTVLKSDALYYDVRRFKWHYNCPAFRLVWQIAKNLFLKYPPSGGTPKAAEPGTNCFDSDAGEVCIPRADMLCPSIRLSDADLKTALTLAGGSLDYLREFFPKAEFTIVYIPSPITSYPIRSPRVTVQLQNVDEPFTADTKEVFAKSDEHFEAVRRLGAERGIRVLDMRPYLRAAARRRGLIHGPKDPYHLNRAGYEALVDGILAETGWSRKAA